MKSLLRVRRSRSLLTGRYSEGREEKLPVPFTKAELGTAPVCMGFADRETGENDLFEELSETDTAEKNFLEELMSPAAE